MSWTIERPVMAHTSKPPHPRVVRFPRILADEDAPQKHSDQSSTIPDGVAVQQDTQNGPSSLWAEQDNIWDQYIEAGYFDRAAEQGRCTQVMLRYWFTIYGTRVLGYAGWITQNADLAKDAIQDAAEIALKKERWPPPLFPRAMYTIVRNVSRTIKRDRGNRARIKMRLADALVDIEVNDAADMYAEIYMLRQEAARLTGDDYDILLENMIGYNLREIADRHEISISTAMRRIKRALNKLERL